MGGHNTTDTRAPGGRGNLLSYVGLGIAAGLSSGLLGIGSGVVNVPVLMLIVGLSARKAICTSLWIIVPVSFVGAAAYTGKDILYADNFIVWPASVCLIAGVVPGAVLGSLVSFRMRESAVRTVLALLLFVVAARMIYSLFTPGDESGRFLEYMGFTMRDSAIVAAFGLAAGFLSAMLGIGGGSLTVPPMVLVYGFDMHVAVPTALIAVVPTALAGAVMQYRKSPVSKDVLAVVLPVAMVAAVTGAIVQNHISNEFLRGMFGIMLLAASVKLFTSRASYRDASA